MNSIWLDPPCFPQDKQKQIPLSKLVVEPALRVMNWAEIEYFKQLPNSLVFPKESLIISQLTLNSFYAKRRWAKLKLAFVEFKVGKLWRSSARIIAESIAFLDFGTTRLCRFQKEICFPFSKSQRAFLGMISVLKPYSLFYRSAYRVRSLLLQKNKPYFSRVLTIASKICTLMTTALVILSSLFAFEVARRVFLTLSTISLTLFLTNYYSEKLNSFSKKEVFS